MRSERLASANRFDEPGCPICRDRGWLRFDVPLDHPDFGSIERCRCMEGIDDADRRRRFLRLCRLPEATEDRTFENFEVRPGLEEAYQASLDVAEGRLKWLTLSGGVDAGKSHLAIAIAKWWLQRDRPARYTMVPELLDDLRRGYHPDADISYDQEFHFYKNVDLLALDDLGTESTTPWAQERLDTLVNYRYEHGLPLVVTLNLTMEEISPRIASRLQRAPFGRVVSIRAPEYRLWKFTNSDKKKR